ncbi:MAG: hypothetical protein JST80_05620 [Bdellovibrionales bacterium]|nr:hypothetical protein [Bdellovibrionales bacterium]
MSTSIFKRLSAVLSVALIVAGSSSRADVADEGWGDMGYSKASAEVEAIPSSIDGDKVEPSPEALRANSVTTTQSSAESGEQVIASEESAAPVVDNDVVDNGARPLDRDNEAAARAETQAKADARAKELNSKKIASKPAKNPATGRNEPRSFGNISTARNTYGVETEENPGVQFYVSPFGGVTSVMGNTTVDVNPKYALGAQAGLLLTSNFLLNLGFTYSEQSLSAPRINNTRGTIPATQDVFGLKSSHIEAGGRLFFLGREARIRPFFGGGFGWAKNYVNYNTANLQALGYQPQYVQDYTLSQFDGFGELGAEVAITRAIVATASFRLRGVLGVSTSADDAASAVNYDTAKIAAGSSLSRSASYTVGAGVGIYF